MSRFIAVIDLPDDSTDEDKGPLRPWTPDEVEEAIDCFAEGYGAMVVKGPLGPGDWATALIEANAELDQERPS